MKCGKNVLLNLEWVINSSIEKQFFYILIKILNLEIFSDEFLTKHKGCFDDDDTRYCLMDLFQKIDNISDDYFNSLAMTHSKADYE